MLSGCITPTICFCGSRYNSTNTFRTYCRIDGALIMPRSYYSSRAYSGYRPKTIGGTSLWALSGVSPNFSRKFREQCSYLQVFGRVARVRLLLLLLLSLRGGYATTIILTIMGGPTLRFRATTSVTLGRFYQLCDGSLNATARRVSS